MYNDKISPDSPHKALQYNILMIPLSRPHWRRLIPSAPIPPKILPPPTPHAINNDWSAKQPPPWTIQTFGGRSACCQVRPHLSDHIVFVRSLAKAPDAVISSDNVNIISYKSDSVTCHLGALADQLEDWRGKKSIR